MSQRLDALKAKVRELLPDHEVILGWRQGYDSLHAAPLFIRKPEDVDQLIFGPTCTQNLVNYLYQLRGKKVGVLVKGCDSRSVVQMLQEKLLDKDLLTVIGLPCDGVVDVIKLTPKVDVHRVQDLSFGNGSVALTIDGAPTQLKPEEVLADRCLRCQYPNPLVYDHLVGEPRDTVGPKAGQYDDLDHFEQKELCERFDFWRAHMNRCIRCYACRNACPMCVCREHCLSDSREPHWFSQEANVREKWMFQVLHVLHLAGRCTECGECERACPMNIPILLLKRKMNKEIKDVFGYEAGVDPTATPPLHTYKVDEDKIVERDL